MPNVRTSLTLTLLVMLVTFALGCSGGSKVDLQETGADASSAVETAKSPAPPADGIFFGSVMEKLDAGGYTYVRLEKGDESVWAAGPKSSVEVGEELGVSLDMVMPDFYSDTLQRRFDAVYFVGGFVRGDSAGEDGGGSPEQGGMADAHPGGSGSADPHAGMDMGSGLIAGDYGGSSRSIAPSTEARVSGVQKPEGGYTIAELWEGRADLADQTVVFRGKVMKFNSGILGRNWVHLQDGSGDPARKTHDITVTSQQSVQVGDIVTVRGVLILDKDFGAGYKYSMIVEEASLEVSL